MKIAFIADSMCLPRGETEGNISYENTYPVLLEDAFHHAFGVDRSPRLIVRGKRSRTIVEVKHEWKEVIDFIKPEIVVVHVGITDCAPRILDEKARKKVASIKIGFIKTAVINYLKRNRTKLILKDPNKRFVDIEKFKTEYQEILKHLLPRTQKLIFVGILNVSDALENKSPGYLSSIVQYNEVLKSGSDNKKIYFLDVNSEFKKNDFGECRLYDGYHFTARGNKIVADMLFKILKSDFE